MILLAREISRDIDLYTSREKERKVLDKIQLVLYSNTFDTIYPDTLKKLYSTERVSESRPTGNPHLTLFLRWLTTP